MPSIQTASILVTSFNNGFVSPWGNNELIPLYSSVPLKTPVVGCLPCVVCGGSPIRDEIVANAGGLGGAGFGVNGRGRGGFGSGSGGGGGDEVIITLNANIFPADFIVLRFLFTDGLDLDTGTRIMSPELGPYVGWGSCKSDSFTGSNGLVWYEWGGDNRGTGYEAVLINVKNIRSAYPDSNISGECFGNWYEAIESGNVVVSLTGYLGGVMEQVGFDYRNVGGEQTAYITKQTNSQSLRRACFLGDLLTNFVYTPLNQLSWV
jgi:hypothetical protein